MITSRLTSKGRTTVPQQVRDALNLHVGDNLQFDMQGEKVVLTKATQASEPFTAFEEWHGEADRRAYADL